MMNLRALVAAGGRLFGSRRNFSSSSSSVGGSEEQLKMTELIFGNAGLGYALYVGYDVLTMLNARRKILRAMREEVDQYHEERYGRQLD